jgi:ECF sigma factor
VTEAVTELLRRLSAGERGVLDQLLPVVYSELRWIAHRQMRGEREGHTLNATALVHKAYLRLAGPRSDFLARSCPLFRGCYARDAACAHRPCEGPVCAKAWWRRCGRSVGRRHGGTRAARRRSAGAERSTGALERLDPRQVKVVECHVFAGMSLEDTAAALDMSPATVSRDWALARAWLNRLLSFDERT